MSRRFGGFGFIAMASMLGGMAPAGDGRTDPDEPDAEPTTWHRAGEPTLTEGTITQPWQPPKMSASGRRTADEREEAIDGALERRLRRAFMASVDQAIRTEKKNADAAKEAPAMRRLMHELVRSAVLVEFDTRSMLESTFTYTNHRGERRARIVALDRVMWGRSDWHPNNGSAWFLEALDLERDDCPMRDFDIALIERTR